MNHDLTQKHANVLNSGLAHKSTFTYFPHNTELFILKIKGVQEAFDVRSGANI
jgi:hypothetical protein